MGAVRALGARRLPATAILVVNNVRDVESDRRAGKRTLAVRFGRERMRMVYAALLVGAFVVAQVPWIAGGDLDPWVLLVLLAVPLAARVTRTVATHTDGPALNGALAQTGLLQLVFCLLLGAGILLS